MTTILTCIIIILLSATQPVLAQSDTTFTGTIDDKFNLSSTHKVSLKERPKLEQEINSFAKKLDVLNPYFKAANENNFELAAKIISSDSLLSRMDSETLDVMFGLVKMQELGILYRPLIQVNDGFKERRLIACTEKQKMNLVKDRKYILYCKYVGELIVENAKVYQLISFQ
ncbi:MAG: hypothetical protein V4642_08405 [Bacteroidota bacterium]